MTAPSLRVFDPQAEPAAEARASPLPLLSREPLPDTHWPYYSRKLECWWLIDVKGWQVPSLTVGPELIPVYRLTPASFAWFWRAVHNLCAKPGAGDSARWAMGVLMEMDAWLTTHGLSDEVRKWQAREVQPLPDPQPVYDDRPRKIDASFNKRRRAEEN